MSGLIPKFRDVSKKSLRTVALCGFLAVFLGLALPQHIRAALCVGSNLPYGSCYLQLGSYPGEYPFAMTMINVEEKLAVADLYSGVFYKFDPSDLNSGSEAVFGPLGPATYTGVTYHPGENSLYWLVKIAQETRLVKSSNGGNQIAGGSTTLTVPPGGYLAGLTWNESTGTFWTNDIENDVYLELTIDGSFTGNEITSPGTTTFGGQAHGIGLTAVHQPAPEDTWFLDLPYGTPADGQARRVTRVRTTGEEFGLFYELGFDNELTGWVTGIAWTANGSNGGPSEFLADLDNNRIVEVPVLDPNSPSIIGLTCSADSQNSVTLSWTNPVSYDTIQILREGQLIATLPSGVDTFIDDNLDSDSFSYSVKPIPASGNNLPAAGCNVVVGFGRLINSAPHVGGTPRAITAVESIGLILVADANAPTVSWYQKDLVASTQGDAPFTSGGTAGVAWNSKDDTLLWLGDASSELILTDIDGTILSGPVTLASPLGGVLGGITYDPGIDSDTGSYIGVDRSNGVYFGFNADGSFTGIQISFPTIGVEIAEFAYGLATVGDPENLVIDVAVGSSSNGAIDRVIRLLNGNSSGFEFDLLPSTLSGSIGGIAWTPVGSIGISSEYVVGIDTQTIYELSLDLSNSGDDFRRGDSNLDGALNLVDVTKTLLYLFGGGTTSLDCLDSADSNDDGTLNISDAVALLDYLFSGGEAPPAPTGSCGADDTDDALTCEEYTGC